MEWHIFIEVDDADGLFGAYYTLCLEIDPYGNEADFQVGVGALREHFLRGDMEGTVYR
jgi:hypothetical protein